MCGQTLLFIVIANYAIEEGLLSGKLKQSDTSTLRQCIILGCDSGRMLHAGAVLRCTFVSTAVHLYVCQVLEFQREAYIYY